LHTQAFYRFNRRFGKHLTAGFDLVGLFSVGEKLFYILHFSFFIKLQKDSLYLLLFNAECKMQNVKCKINVWFIKTRQF